MRSRDAKCLRSECLSPLKSISDFIVERMSYFPDWSVPEGKSALKALRDDVILHNCKGRRKGNSTHGTGNGVDLSEKREETRVI